ncbi:MAG TPA: cyanophycin synthetase, partial [Pseudoxanthomonas sp.]|nr:cyanophycin synthetase [Pseudoxanthomonas sp.]
VLPGATVRVDLPLPGRHSVMNALAAAACACACGVAAATIAEGLAAARPVAGRQVAHELADGVMLIDDSYNANPGSLAAAIDTLAASGDAAWLVLGDMHELGPGGEAMHADAGRRAKDARIGRLYTLGTLSAAAAAAFGPGARGFESHDALSDALLADLRARTGGEAGRVRILVKGSRGSAMDRVVARLLAAAKPTAGEGAAHVA